MASLHEQKGDRPGWKIRYRDADQKQRAIWLGKVSKRNANTIFRHVSELIASNVNDVRPDASTEKWASELTGPLLTKLTKAGLVQSRRSRDGSDADKLLGPYCDRFIKQMVDADPGTRSNYKQSRDWLCKHFGENKPLIEITVADMGRWDRFLRSSGLARSNRNKHIQRAKKYFATAVDDRLLRESPAKKLKQERPPKGQQVDRSKQQFVDTTITAEVIEALPAGDITLAFVLARYMGLRRCEIYSLTWNDVDWERARLRIDSQKTGERHCPIFPMVMPYFNEAYFDSPDGAKRIITHFNSAASITALMRKHIVRTLGESRMWPKVMQQLRSTRRTELEELFPNHVVNDWLGHDGKTAEQHYLQVTPEHWERAKTAAGGNVGGNIDATEGQNTARTDTDKTPEATANDRQSSPAKGELVPPKGFEPLFPD